MKKSDLPELSRIYVRAYKAYSKWEKWNAKAAYKLLEYYLKRQTNLAFVAEYNNKIAGAFVAGVKPWWDGNHLLDGELFVDPDYQRKGVGKILLKAMLQKSVEKYDAKIWEAVTFKKTEFPLSWYKKLGFREIKELAIFSGNVKKVLKKLKYCKRS